MDRVSIVPVTPDDESLLREIVELGDTNRKTLGFLPPAAFSEAARRQTLLAVVDQDLLLGYALFGLPANEVRLTHLVVAEAAQGKGVARTLVEEISRIHSDRRGIRAKCRRDYGIDEMWLRLGFQPINEVPGRGLEKKPLVVWHRKHPGHVDLFTYKDEPVLRAAIDFNVLRDLYDTPMRRDANESHALVANHLAGILELVVTSALQSEIGAVEDNQLRTLYRSRAAVNHEYAAPAHKDISRYAGSLLRRVNEHFPSYPENKQDKADVSHIAATAAAGLTVFTTRDEALINTCGTAAQEEFGLRVLRPADVVVRIDELVRADAYRPATLHGTGYTTATISSGGEAELSRFRNTENRERNQDFLRRLRTYSSAAFNQWERIIVRSPNGDPVAMYVYGPSTEHDCLEVPVLRLDPRHNLAGTLARQILSELRRKCIEADKSLLKISDENATLIAYRAALFDGFFESSGALNALAINHCGTANEIRRIGESVLRRAGMSWTFPSNLNLSAVGVAELETVLWPAKISDGRIPCYIIPIQPRWSIDLFGVPETLPYFRPDELGISREHVYYRSPNGPLIRTPARILWYLSQGRGPHSTASAIIACSLLDEVVVDSPTELHERFRHLGVFQLEHVESAARRGKAQALRFTHTEVFSNPLSGNNLRSFLADRRFNLPLMSVRQIESDLFIAAYRKGCHDD